MLGLAVVGPAGGAALDPARAVVTSEVTKAHVGQAEKRVWTLPRFWQRLALCETGGRWDWGRYANSPAERHLEGTSFEGGLGFAASSWRVWAKAVRVLDRYPHAWMAPPRVQVKVGKYGLRQGGSWGCLSYASR